MTHEQKLSELEQRRMEAVKGHDPVLVRRLNRQIATLRAKVEGRHSDKCNDANDRSAREICVCR